MNETSQRRYILGSFIGKVKRREVQAHIFIASKALRIHQLAPWYFQPSHISWNEGALPTINHHYSQQCSIRCHAIYCPSTQRTKIDASATWSAPDLLRSPLMQVVATPDFNDVVTIEAPCSWISRFHTWSHSKKQRKTHMFSESLIGMIGSDLTTVLVLRIQTVKYFMTRNTISELSYKAIS